MPNYAYFWYVIAHFGFFFFFIYPDIMKRGRNFVYVYESVCVHAHAQIKRSTASKFDAEILKRIFEKTLKWLFFNLSRFFRIIFKNTFLDFSINYFFISRFFASLRSTQYLQPRNYYKASKEGFWEDFKEMFSKLVLDQNLEYLFELQVK